ncbi:MAG: aldo/keto reductase [Planctomycetota bacterium]
MSGPVRWGIIGAGTIAKAFVHGVSEVDEAEVVAVASRSVEKAKDFTADNGLPDAAGYGSYDAMLADDNVEAVYVTLPHPMHARTSITVAQAGKHVLCEKPAALNHPEAIALLQAVDEAGVFYMEAFKDRCHPQTAKLVKLLHKKVIGEVRMIDVSFGFGGGDSIDPAGRLFDPALGGGGILDVGCYAVEYARLVAGAAVGRPFLDPVGVTGAAHLGETGVDEWAAATLKFETGAVAQVATAVRANLKNACRIVGAYGTITVPDPWLNRRDGAEPGQILVTKNGETETIHVPPTRSGFGHEVAAACAAIRDGKREADAPAMTHADTLGQATTLDGWRRAIKLVYPAETPAGFPTPLNGRPAAPLPDAPMTYGHVPGLDRPVSKFIMGCDNQPNFPHAAVMFDDWVQRGGNTFDTAFIYAGGRIEQLLGQWVRSRGVRDDVNLIVKGAHTPHCTPEGITKQLLISLDRLQADHADIYIMHRDNPGVPVGEFVDVLHEHAEAGRITVFGGSNWGVERFAAANEYAAANGKRTFALMSNNFSLARMVNPVWAGCVAATVPATRDYLIEHQVPNFAWSSQARGYFVSRSGEGNDVWKEGDAWDAPDNRLRRERAFELAERKGVTAINIAAAYVLSQPFPSFALIGPRQLRETATSLPALGLTLTEDEMAYLDLRDAGNPV